MGFWNTSLYGNDMTLDVRDKLNNLLKNGVSPQIQSSIYSTNLIEGFNKQLKRKTNRKEQLPNEESMEKFLVAIFTEYNTKNYNRAYKGFNKISIDS